MLAGTVFADEGKGNSILGRDKWVVGFDMILGRALDVLNSGLSDIEVGIGLLGGEGERDMSERFSDSLTDVTGDEGSDRVCAVVQSSLRVD